MIHSRDFDWLQIADGLVLIQRKESIATGLAVRPSIRTSNGPRLNNSPHILLQNIEIKGRQPANKQYILR